MWSSSACRAWAALQEAPLWSFSELGKGGLEFIRLCGIPGLSWQAGLSGGRGREAQARGLSLGNPRQGQQRFLERPQLLKRSLCSLH